MGNNQSIDEQLEWNYNNTLRRGDAAEVLQGWAERSAAYRQQADATLDCVYGDGERERIDLFRSGIANAPLLVYIHGGYWQRGDKSIYSFIADAYNARGIDVAVPGYPLCPEVSMTDLLGSVRRALVWLYRNAVDHGLSPTRIHLSGHSAGGHLTAMGMATAWNEYGADLPDDMLRSATALSGLFRLAPLLRTSIANALELSDDEVESLSPINLSPVCRAPFQVVVGGIETPEFFSQADDLITAWSASGSAIERYVEPEVDHFDVVERFADGDSELFRRVCAQIS